MADFPEFSAQDVSDFSGRPVAAYPQTYTATALKQARTLFKLGTCLKQFPDEEFEAELATNAILSMAEQLILSQKYQAALANPFQSESIGSYSYSKITGVVATGVPTGLFWFDSAVQRLGVCDIAGEGSIGGGSSGGIEVFEHDGRFGPGTGNNVRLYGPADGYNYDGSRRPD